MYNGICEYVSADCNLIKKDKMTIEGKVKIYKNTDNIELFINKTNINNLITVNGKVSQYDIKIERDLLPSYFYCEITNFTEDDRINKLIGKEIILKLHKVMVSADITFTMFDDETNVKCKITPIYDQEKHEFGTIIVK
jgi:hypothetical protein